MEPISALVFSIALQMEAKYGVDAHLIYAIAKVESQLKPHAVGSSHGEIGLMQLRPKYFPDASFDPYKNMEMATRYLVKLKRVCTQKYGDAWFVCYNVGPNKKLANAKQFKYYKKVYGERKKIIQDRRRVASN